MKFYSIISRNFLLLKLCCLSLCLSFAFSNSSIFAEDKKTDMKDKKMMDDDKKAGMKDKKMMADGKKTGMKDKKMMADGKKTGMKDKKMMADGKKTDMKDKKMMDTAKMKMCELELTADDQMKFSTKELMVGADCKTLTLTLKHVGKLPKAAMGHNVVFAEKSKKDELVKLGLKAGPDKGYIPDSKDVLLATKLLGGGESDTVKVDVSTLMGKDLVFFCLFPGHTAAMTGTVKLETADADKSS